MPHLKVLKRGEPDPGGKSVDLYPEVGLVRALVFNRGRETSRERLLPQVVKVMERIAASSNRRVRERDFPIWFGEPTNRLGMDLSTISMPVRIDHRVFGEFYKAFRDWDSFLEAGAYQLVDAGGEPAARYVHGLIIVYGSPFDEAGAVPDYLADLESPIEFRSAQRQATRRSRTRYAEAEAPGGARFGSAPDSARERRHTLDIWFENRKHILDFVYNLKGPCGFRRLAEISRESFGVGVFEEPSHDFQRYGCIRLGWLRDRDNSATVRILINSRLDDRLKYVVLAHELAHYVQHFPLLFAGQIVEEQSWSMPEMEFFYRDLVTRHHPRLLREVELDAFEFGAFFLIPPCFFPVERISKVILEGGENPRPEFLIWRWLQAQLPEGGPGPVSWSSYDAMKERADSEVEAAMQSESGASSIFDCTLAAALRLEQGTTTGTKISGEILEVLQQTMGMITRTATLEVDDARAEVRKRLSATSESGGPSILEELGVGTRGFCRELLPPLEPRGDSRFSRRIPLVPASFNLAGSPRGDWQYLERLESSPYGTVEDWRKHRPEFSVVLYRFETWQQQLLRGL